MPDVLALRLGGPLQSWGTATRHTTRGTQPHPTKSGVIGLCAAALGRPRGADLSDLCDLRFGVRVDRGGRLLVDYHTMSAASHGPLEPHLQRLPTAEGGSLKVGEGKISRRHYLQDAVFVVGLEGDPELLRELGAALRRPRYPLFLGRRSCPPDRPVFLSLTPGKTLEQVFTELPWQGGRAWWREPHAPDRLPVFMDDPLGEELLEDLPAGGSAFARKFTQRPVRHTSAPLPEDSTDPGSPMGDGFGFDGDAALDLLDEEA